MLWHDWLSRFDGNVSHYFQLFVCTLNGMCSLMDLVCGLTDSCHCRFFSFLCIFYIACIYSCSVVHMRTYWLLAYIFGCILNSKARPRFDLRNSFAIMSDSESSITSEQVDYMISNLELEAEHPGLDRWTTSQMVDDLIKAWKEEEEEKKKKKKAKPRWRKGALVARKKVNRPRWRKGTLVDMEDFQML